MFRRKKNDCQYKVESLGPLIVEKVQMPHSLEEVDGSKYEILQWIFRLRLDDGPVFMERVYGAGEKESIEKMKNYLNPYVEVDSETQALYLFYDALRDFMVSK